AEDDELLPRHQLDDLAWNDPRGRVAHQHQDNSDGQGSISTHASPFRRGNLTVPGNRRHAPARPARQSAMLSHKSPEAPKVMPAVLAERKSAVPAVGVDKLDLRMVNDPLTALPCAIAQIHVLEVEKICGVKNLTLRKVRAADKHRRPQSPVDLDRPGRL